MNSNKTNKGEGLNYDHLKNIARAAEITLTGVGRENVILGSQVQDNGDIDIFVTWVTYARIEELAVLCKRHKFLFYIEPVLRENVRTSCPAVNGIGPILRVHLLPEYRS